MQPVPRQLQKEPSFRFLSDYNFIRELEEINRLLFLLVSALSLNMILRLK